MIYGLSGRPLPPGLLYGSQIEAACEARNFPPCAAYGVANRETLRAQRSGWLAATFAGKDAATVITGDGGHGVFQLTSSFPDDWADVMANTLYALDHFLVPSMHYYAGAGHEGDELLDLIADAFNAGSGRVNSFRVQGLTADMATTGGDYGADVLRCYHALLESGVPT
jgi:hypothetical protein